MNGDYEGETEASRNPKSVNAVHHKVRVEESWFEFRYVAMKTRNHAIIL